MGMARASIMEKLHLDHCGPDRCIQKAKNYYFWQNMSKDIKSLIAGCDKCLTYSASKPRAADIATIADRPFERISMDYAEFKGRKSNYAECGETKVPNRNRSSRFHWLRN